MFNVAEKKSLLVDLAEGLLLGATEARSSSGKKHSSNIHHHLTLEDYGLFKMKDFQLCFLSKCLSIVESSVSVPLCLSNNQCDQLTDISRVILREANNEGDFLPIRMIYQISASLGIYVGGHFKTLRAILKRHEAWQNPQLWCHTLKDLVDNDVQRWINRQAVWSKIFPFPLTSQELIMLLSYFRLKSLAWSMMSDFEFQSDFIEKTLHGYHSFDYHEEICEATPLPIALWLVHTAVGAFNHPESSSPQSRTANKQGGGLSSHSINIQMKKAVENVTRASSWRSLGFSIQQEILSFIVERMLGRAEQVERGHRIASVSCTCLCGRFYEPWKLLGGFSTSTCHNDMRMYCPHLLCEECLRYLTNDRPLTARTALLPQRVGCAVLPSTEIHPPTSASSFWKTSSQLIQEREDTIDRLTQKINDCQARLVTASISSNNDSHGNNATSLKGSDNISKRRHQGSKYEDNDFISQFKRGVEVLKHNRGIMAGAPQLRYIFLDETSGTTLLWCKKKEDRLSKSTLSKGFLLQDLKEVRTTPNRRKDRAGPPLICLVFKKRSLVLEALSQDQFDFLIASFTALFTAHAKRDS